MIKYFENIGNQYIKNTLSVIDINKMQNDKDYAIKMFFYYWAFERKDAPNGYKISAIKALTSDSNENLTEKFEKYFKGKRNKKNNPFYSNNIDNIDICKTILEIKNLNFDEAFKSIKLNGLGHKIRSFFIRDIVCLLKLEALNDFETQQYLFMIPIDIWVRYTIDFLSFNEPYITDIYRKDYGISKNDFLTSIKLITECKKYKVSPLKVNMGIWYYCSNIIADKERLKEIIETKSVLELENERKLLGIFGNRKQILVN